MSKLIRVSDELHERLSIASTINKRTLSAQIEYMQDSYDQGFMTSNPKILSDAQIKNGTYEELGVPVPDPTYTNLEPIVARRPLDQPYIIGKEHILDEPAFVDPTVTPPEDYA